MSVLTVRISPQELMSDQVRRHANCRPMDWRDLHVQKVAKVLHDWPRNRCMIFQTNNPNMYRIHHVEDVNGRLVQKLDRFLVTTRGDLRYKECRFGTVDEMLAALGFR